MKEPLVSVVMPVRNGDLYLAEAIESILEQTYQNFEFIIINDASDDQTPQILTHYQKQDARIVVLHNRKNLGVAASLNKGIDVTKGTYIARMDADDISMPDRLSKQVAFLEKHTHIGVLGTAIRYVKDDQLGKVITYRNNSFVLKWECLIHNPVAHPTVLMRSDVIHKAGRYSEQHPHTEDYELWSRLIFKHKIKFANINQVLLHYRIHAASVTRNNQEIHFILNQNVSKRNIHNYYPVTDAEVAALKRFSPPSIHSLPRMATQRLLKLRILIPFIVAEKPTLTEIRGILWQILV
jgi:glycosyltransferase involved in cell wall biosynthesis